MEFDDISARIVERKCQMNMPVVSAQDAKTQLLHVAAVLTDKKI